MVAMLTLTVAMLTFVVVMLAMLTLTVATLTFVVVMLTCMVPVLAFVVAMLTFSVEFHDHCGCCAGIHGCDAAVCAAALTCIVRDAVSVAL
eukprot:3269732-Rhodomonas_salina.1